MMVDIIGLRYLSARPIHYNIIIDAVNIEVKTKVLDVTVLQPALVIASGVTPLIPLGSQGLIRPEPRYYTPNQSLLPSQTNGDPSFLAHYRAT
jgi:hypothetical protein